MQCFSQSVRMHFLAVVVVLLAVAQSQQEEPHKRDYYVTVEKVVTDFYKYEYYSKESYMRADMYNDSQSIAEGKLYQIKEFPDNVQRQIEVIAFKKSEGNVWIDVVKINMQPFCIFAKENVFGKMVMRHTNFDLSKCPEPKGTWIMKDFVVDTSVCPPRVSPSNWRIEAMITLGGYTPLLKVIVFADVRKIGDDD